ETFYTTAYKNANRGATTFNYDQRLYLDTSFTGKDLLRTLLRAGNFQESAYNYGLLKLDPAFQESAGANVVGVNRLFYAFPLGEKFNFNVGARVRIDDPGMLAIGVPSVYKPGLLDFFTRAGSPGVYNKSGFGSGFGGTYKQLLGIKGLAISSNYVSVDGSDGDPSAGGIMSAGSNSVSVTQLGYVGRNAPFIGGSYAIALGYTFAQNSKVHRATPYAWDIGYTGPSNTVGASAYWQPVENGLIPSVSLGWGLTAAANAMYNEIPYETDHWAKTQSWMVGLQWNDALRKGNKAGMAVGQAPYVTDNGGGSVGNVAGASTPMDSNYMWEWWYEYQVSDNISIKPALYYINNLDGQYGKVNTSSGAYNAKDNVFGGLVMTTFRF
ncbi:MAG: carbohydrate porin, partial [Cyanobacteria bacterium]|nr:carbohydrate porin [Cyanobacteriota bacterium]